MTNSAEPTLLRVDLDTATELRPTGERNFSATVHPSWDGPLSTHGGILAVLALQAVDRVVNPELALQVRTLGLHFLRPPVHGEIEIEVEPLRTGRRFTNARVQIKQGDRHCVTAMAIHSVRGLPQVGAFQESMPLVEPAPLRDAGRTDLYEHSLTLDDGWLESHSNAVPFFHQLMIAPRFGGAIFNGTPVPEGRGDENGGWVLLPEPRIVDPRLLALYVDAFWPSSLQALKLPVMAPTLDLTIHFRAELPPEGLPDQPLLVHNTTAALIDGTSDSDSRVFTADGRLLAQARQLQFVTPYET